MSGTCLILINGDPLFEDSNANASTTLTAILDASGISGDRAKVIIYAGVDDAAPRPKYEESILAAADTNHQRASLSITPLQRDRRKKTGVSVAMTVDVVDHILEEGSVYNRVVIIPENDHDIRELTLLLDRKKVSWTYLVSEDHITRMHTNSKREIEGRKDKKSKGPAGKWEAIYEAMRAGSGRLVTFV